MSSDKSPIQSVPTNVITGFLGSGKTTAILHLLSQKPKGERWAVLVNEFGEIGIDGSLFSGRHGEGEGVYIREVPGGCMCCAAGLPMQIALNQLLIKARPERLLIEPTGLGHPKEVLETLMAENMREVLSIGSTITLVDAAKLRDQRYAGHDTFRQQVEVADVVVGNKADGYEHGDDELLRHYVSQFADSGVRVTFTEQGKINLDLLDGGSRFEERANHAAGSAGSDSAQRMFFQVPKDEARFRSIGWRFSPEKVFSYDALANVLYGIEADRMKAVFITDRGLFGYNLASGTLTEIELDECIESRIELIASRLDESLRQRLLECLAG